MNYFTRKRIIIFGVILLIIINITAIGTMIYFHKADDKPAILTPKEEEIFEGINHFLKRKLHLDDDQYNKIVELRRENFSMTKSIMQELDKKRDEMLDEFVKEDPSRKKLDKIAGDIGDLHYRLKMETIDHFLQMKKLCTPEQQEHLNHIFKKIQSWEMNGSRHESPHRRNRRGGYRNNNIEQDK